MDETIGLSDPATGAGGLGVAEESLLNIECLS
jgi:hypothetical protein